MIRINLLPTEKRKAERTPLPRFLLIASTAAAFFILLFYNLFVLKMISDTTEEIKRQQQLLADLRPDVELHDKLLAEETQLKNKVLEIKSLINREVEYWRTVNALWDVIHNNPRVWIDDLRILDAKAAPGDLKRVDPDNKDAVAYGIAMRCHVAGDEVTEMTKFRKALKEHPILQETLTLINFNVQWNVTDEKGQSNEETHAIDFDISMFGLATKPKRKSATPAPGAPTPPKPGTVPIKAPTPGAPAPAGGAK
jgi:hypothetical protein